MARAKQVEATQLQTHSASGLTFATSTYGRDWLPQGRGVGKRGRKKGTPKKDTRPVHQREGWRALQGDPPPSTKMQDKAVTDSAAVVPHSRCQMRTESTSRQVPQSQKIKIIHTSKQKTKMKKALKPS